MHHSESINELAAALAAASLEFEPARKTAANPYFKSRYADLAEVVASTRCALGKHGLSVTQPPRMEGGTVYVETVIMHASGQWISSEIGCPPKALDPQGVGSCITYLRRYGLMAALGLAAEDDDAEGAMGRPPLKAVPKPQKHAPAPVPPAAPKPAPVSKSAELPQNGREALEKRLQIALYKLCPPPPDNTGVNRDGWCSSIEHILGDMFNEKNPTWYQALKLPENRIALAITMLDDENEARTLDAAGILAMIQSKVKAMGGDDKRLKASILNVAFDGKPWAQIQQMVPAELLRGLRKVHRQRAAREQLPAEKVS